MDPAKYGVFAAVGVGIALALYLWWPASDAKPALAATCPAILPTAGASNGYSFYATNNNGDFAYGVLHFYPNGFRHNAAILLDQSNSPSTDPVILLDIAVPGGCAPADGSQPATLTLTKDGTPAAVLHFGPPTSESNAAFAVTFAPSGSGNPNPVPIPQGMTGSAYLIGNQ